MASFGPALQALIKQAKEYKGAAINVVIVGGTVALKKITQNEKFRCPCVPPDVLKGCTRDTGDFYNSTFGCSKTVNFYYGISHIVFPAFALYFVGMLATPRLWKIITGCLTSTPGINQRRRSVVPVIVAVNIKALLAPFTWLIIMLLDGKYFACAVTSLPYDVGEKKTYASCSVVAKTEKVCPSDAFNTNVIISQIVGWAVFAVLVCLGFIGFALIASSSPLTYYHAKYFKIYKENEEYEINDEMKIKAQLDAEANVRSFMAQRRPKKDWDEISQVYEYRKDKLNLSVYSCLHHWILNHPNSAQQQTDYQSLGGGPGETSETIPLVPK